MEATAALPAVVVSEQLNEILCSLDDMRTLAQQATGADRTMASTLCAALAAMAEVNARRVEKCLSQMAE